LGKVILSRGKKTVGDRIQRFPRYAEDYPPEKKLVKMASIRKQVSEGKVPVRYDKLSPRMKKIARLAVRGVPIDVICKMEHLDSNTYYRWIHYHKLFQKYYLRYANKQASIVGSRLDAKLGRSVTVLEDALESRDPYLQTDTALRLLKGRGKLIQNIQTKQQISGHIDTTSEVHHTHEMDKEFAQMFVEAMLGKATGMKTIQPTVIDLKALPPAEVESLIGQGKTVQASRQRASVEKDK